MRSGGICFYNEDLTMKVYQEQTDFSGGANDYLSPELLPENAYQYGHNIEIRDGSAASRRSETDLMDQEDFAGDTLQGVGLYRTSFSSGNTEYIIQARGEKLYYWQPPGVMTEMTLPAGKTLGTGECGFCRFLGNLYMFRSTTDEVWKWDGNTAHDWDVLAAPSAGDQFPNTSYAVEKYSRIWAVTSYNELAASDLLSEAFDLTDHSWAIGADSSDGLLCVAPLAGGRLVAFKERSVHVISGCSGDLSDIIIEELDGTNGCVGKYAWCQVGGDVWFFSRDGIRTVSLTSENTAQMVDVPLSKSISGVISTVNMLHASKIRALVHDNYVLFAVPTNAATENSSIIAYDLIKRAWVGVWSPIESTALLRSFALANERAIGFRSDGSPFYLLSETELDGDAYIITRGFSCGDAQRKKRFSTSLVTAKSKACELAIYANSPSDDSGAPKLESSIENSIDGLLFIPDEGLTIPDEGIYLDKPITELREFWTGEITQWMQLTIQCASGNMALKTIRLSANTSGKTVSEE